MITIGRRESDFHPAAGGAAHAARPASPPASLDAFLECRSRSALGCLAEGFVTGFLAAITFPFWALSSCSDSPTYGEFVPTGDAESDVIWNTPPFDTRSSPAGDSVADTPPPVDVVDTVVAPDDGTPEVLDASSEALASETTASTDDGMTLVDMDVALPVETDAGTETVTDGATDAVGPAGDGDAPAVAADATDAVADGLFVADLPEEGVIDAGDVSVQGNSAPQGIPVPMDGVSCPNVSKDVCNTGKGIIPFKVTILDDDQDPIKVSLSVYHNTHYIGGKVKMFDNSIYKNGKPVTLELSASDLTKGASEYCYDYKLEDGKGGVFTTSKNCFIYCEPGLLGLWTFNQKNGTTVTDDSGNGVNAALGGNNPAPTWSFDPATGAQMLCLGGNGAHVSITPPDAWKNLDKLSFKARFTMDPKNNPDTFLISWSNEVKHGLLLRFQGGGQKTLFGLCDQTAVCENTSWWWATSNVPIVPNQLHEVTGTINMGSANLFVDGVKSSTKAEAPTKAQLGSSLVFGKLVNSPNLLYSFIGCIDEIAFYNTDIAETCN